MSRRPFTGGGGYLPTTWWFSDSAIDLDFQNNRLWTPGGGEANDFTSYLSVSRASTGYAKTATGTLTSFATNTLRRTDLGLLIEGARTNVVLWNRDQTNTAWIKTNMTVALDQTGVDGSSNSATSLLATAGNATSLQAITLGSLARYQSAYIKRITGSGTINMTMDNGATWTAVSPSSDWTLVEIPTQTLANPTVGFRIVTSGDKIAVDFVQNEDGTFATSSILTTTASVTRAADAVSLIGSADTVLQGNTWSMYFQMAAFPFTLPSGQFWRLLGANAGNNKSISLFNSGSTTMRAYDDATPLDATFGSGTIYSGDFKVAYGDSSTPSRSIVANAGTVATDGVRMAWGGAATLLGANQGLSDVWNGYFRHVALWSTRLSDGTLQSRTVP